MAILELQDLEVEFGPEEGGGPHSGASKGCNISGLSLLLC
ncbi:MAG TPA: SapB/AmfS family lanthipeptide [Actinomycetota bacterium]|nr:SapB/AmfS family lanthipeptide [Actinomycetota bacterium]